MTKLPEDEDGRSRVDAGRLDAAGPSSGNGPSLHASASDEAGGSTDTGRSESSKPGAESPPAGPLHLFEGYGVELEYMIARRDDLGVAPIADKLMEAAAGAPESEVERGAIAWSNELVLHVVEMKTNGPASSLAGLAAAFQEEVRAAGDLLAPLDGVLLPTAMHPWMDPMTESRLWPHEYTEVYHAYDRIFGTKGHGWSNLQSTHLNLPFGDEEEFVRLHAAIRVVLPLIPGLAAASPFVQARATGLLDNRLDFYRKNQKKVPEIAGRVIPEAVRSVDEYHDRILGSIYRAIAPHDPDGILQHEWLNSRGAIARFDRGAIEIRLIDLQECPRADLAVVAAIAAAVRALAEERWVSIEDLHAIAIDPLEEILIAGIRDGEAAEIRDAAVLRAFGVQADSGRSRGSGGAGTSDSGSGRTGDSSSSPARGVMTCGSLWAYLIGALVDRELARQEGWDEVYAVLAREGTLARRMLAAVRADSGRGDGTSHAGGTGGAGAETGTSAPATGPAGAGTVIREGVDRAALQALFGTLRDNLAAGRVFEARVDRVGR